MSGHDVVHDRRQARARPAPDAGHWWLLGLALDPRRWPSRRRRAAARRRRLRRSRSKKSAALVLVFFLTRTWLAEPNVVLLLPLVLVLTLAGRARPARPHRGLGHPAGLHRVQRLAAAAALASRFPEPWSVARRAVATLHGVTLVAQGRAGDRLAGRGVVDRRRLPAGSAAPAAASGPSRGEVTRRGLAREAEHPAVRRPRAGDRRPSGAATAATRPRRLQKGLAAARRARSWPRRASASACRSSSGACRRSSRAAWS